MAALRNSALIMAQVMLPTGKIVRKRQQADSNLIYETMLLTDWLVQIRASLD